MKTYHATDDIEFDEDLENHEVMDESDDDSDGSVGGNGKTIKVTADLEKAIIANLINQKAPHRGDYISFIKQEMNIFQDGGCALIFDSLCDTIKKFDDPNKVGITDIVNHVRTQVGEDAMSAIGEAIDEVRGFFGEYPSKETIESYFRDGLIKKYALEIYTNESPNEKKQGELIGLLQHSSTFSLNPSRVKKAFSDADSLYESMHKKGMVIPCHIEDINKRMRGGFSKKELHLFMGQMNMGKSLVLCSLASQMAIRGYKVLYVSHELGDMKVKDRVVRSATQFTGDELFNMSRNEMAKVFQTLKESGVEDNLYIVEFPTGEANVQHIRSVIKELQQQGVELDAIVVDYLGIQQPFRKVKGEGNTNNEIRVVSQELRALAVETETAVFSAMQVNRKGVEKDVLTIAEIADGISAMHIADTTIAITSPMDMNPVKDNPIGAYRFEFLKNRSGQNGGWFYVAFDKDRQHIYDYDQKVEADHSAKISSGVGVLGKEKGTDRFKKRTSGEATKEREKELGKILNATEAEIETIVPKEWEDGSDYDTDDTERLSLATTSVDDIQW